MLALHISHPVSGLRIEECVYSGDLGLLPDGTSRRGRIGGRTMNEEFLAFVWGNIQQLSLRAVGKRGGDVTTPAAPVTVNGRPHSAKDFLREGDRVEWRDFVILVKAPMIPGEHVQEMAERARTDDAAVEVIADWLEGNGSPVGAEYARAMLRPIDPAQLTPIALQLPLSLRASLARGRVEVCQRACSRRWESLPVGGPVPWKRACSDCGEVVSFCDAPDYRPRDVPIVICPSAERRAGDLRPMMVVG